MLKGLKALYISSRLYLIIAVIVLVFVTGFYADILFLAGKLLLGFAGLLVMMDIYLLYFTNGRILIVRELPERLSNGDENDIYIYLKNNYHFNSKIIIIDEIPFRFQIRDFEIKIELKATGEKKIKYSLRPVERGVYEFGKVNAFASSPIGLFYRRFIGNLSSSAVKVYPSFLKMRQYQLIAISDRLNEIGITRIRRIGQHSEFDQIREYVYGDDYRTINWKATARKNKFMVNQYQDERSQQIYSIIDMGRNMQSSFEGMTLLDYAINSSLIISNTVIDKYDKAGLLCFNTSINLFLPAERKNNTMHRILELLYDQKTVFAESNFELLYATIKRRITHRSLLILFSNFESLSSLERQMSFLKKIAGFHMVLLVIFENTEISHVVSREVENLEDIYVSTIAEKFVHEKKVMAKELIRYGIQTIISKPQHLTVNLINKYLELKGRGLI